MAKYQMGLRKGVEVKLFMCHRCDKKGLDQDQLVRHMQKEHGLTELQAKFIANTARPAPGKSEVTAAPVAPTKPVVPSNRFRSTR